MKIEPVGYRHWSGAYRCTAGAAELVVVSEIGPRILSLHWRGSPNLLYEDGTNFGVGDWRLYGGHRFTVAPESHETYAPDNTACLVKVGDRQLQLTAPLAANGMQRTLIISAAQDGDGFDIRQVLENHSQQSWHGALWAITCVPQPGVVAPCGDSDVRFWPGTNKSDWNCEPNYITSATCGIRGKIGWHNNPAWLASLQASATLVIHNPNPPTAMKCVDSGCNVEIFSCPEYLELETLGAEIVLAPGSHATHLQRWRLLEPGFTPRDWPTIAALAGCTSTFSIAHAA
jgi:hypothetical protein